MTVADGADRARLPVLVALLRRLGAGAADGVDEAALDLLGHVPVHGAGREVGVVEVAF